MTRQPRSPGRNGGRLLLASTALLAIGAAAWGISGRRHAGADLATATEAAAVPSVTVAAVTKAPAEEDVVLPGTVQAENDTPIHARTSGYLRRWVTDIGAKVKAGDLLAEIDAPEVDQQLLQARAQLVQLRAGVVQAQANMDLAKVTTDRSSQLVHEGWTTRQQGDQDRLTFTADTAAVDVARANVQAQEANVARLEQLVGFERLVAPFDGVVTARQTDVGSLINAGGGSGPELFHIADTRKLRIYVQVPQSYAARVGAGVGVDLRLPEYPGRSFPARFQTSAKAIDPTARTLLVELEADNEKGEILPGAYTDVHFHLAPAEGGVRVPANALLFRAEGPRIATVGPDDRVVMHPVTLGRDFGTTVEVTKGLKADDRVILNPQPSLQEGTPVHVRTGDTPRSS